MEPQKRFIESRHANVRVEERGDAKAPIISGYAARYYTADDPGTAYRFKQLRGTKAVNIEERIMPGAFARALAEDDVVALLNHDVNIVLGRKSAGTLELRADGLGLGYDINPPESASGVIESIRRGDINGASFSFAPRPGGVSYRDAEINGQPVTIRELTDVQLFDVSPVTFGAYKSATSGLRSEDREALAKELAAWEAEQAAMRGRLAGYMVRARLVQLGLTANNP